MKNARRFAIVLLLISLAQIACALVTPTKAAPQVETNTSAAPSAVASAKPSASPSAAASPEPSAAAATAAASPSATPVASATPTTAPLKLEIVQSQAWTDRDGLVRANVLLRNPYDFPVAPGFGTGARVLNSAGKSLRAGELYFLDGISGGGGFILPGETIAANACFTCEAAPLSEDWASVEFVLGVRDASGLWNYSTEVEASLGDVAFDGDSPIFWVNGTVKNNSASALSRISVRVFVFDQDGKLVGAAEASAWEVGPGATVKFNSYGIGEAPAGPVKYEVTALGVHY